MVSIREDIVLSPLKPVPSTPFLRLSALPLPLPLRTQPRAEARMCALSRAPNSMLQDGGSLWTKGSMFEGTHSISTSALMLELGVVGAGGTDVSRWGVLRNSDSWCRTRFRPLHVSILRARERLRPLHKQNATPTPINSHAHHTHTRKRHSTGSPTIVFFFFFFKEKIHMGNMSSNEIVGACACVRVNYLCHP